MNATRPLAIALAVLAVTTGVAAAAGPGIDDRPADAPDAQAGRIQVDATRTNDTVSLTVSHRGEPLEGAAVLADGSQVGTTDATGAARRGPPAELPDAVPDRVREIHRVVRSFLDGTLDGTLGETLRTLGSQSDAGQTDARPDVANSNEAAA
jgi:hypothetical protein